MIVMIVRYDDAVDARHCAKRHGYRLEALGAEEPRRRGAGSPHRIGEHAKSVDFENVALTVGQGAQAVQVMVGEIRVNAPFIEAILKTVLEKFGPTTPISMTFRKAHFSSGHDLKEFAEKLGLDLQPSDVEQQ